MFTLFLIYTFIIDLNLAKGKKNEGIIDNIHGAVFKCEFN